MRSKYIVFDRDGTLIKHKPYMYQPQMVELFSDTIDSLVKLKNHGYQFFLHTNQSGIGRGMFSLKDAQKCNERMIKLIGLGSNIFKKICIAPEYPPTNNGYRKPSRRFGNDIMNEFKIKTEDLIYVGDSLVDIETGNNLGCKTYALNTGLVNILEKSKCIYKFNHFESLNDLTSYLISNE
tara:strand:+ start:55 stop:594 length:540 start_codon:yes stop_codon:yes gene_type:complete